MAIVSEKVETFEVGADENEGGAADVFRIRVEKEADEMLGVAYSASAKGLVVTGIVQGKAVSMWNHVAEVSRRIVVGDLIIGCNDQEINLKATKLDDSNAKAVVMAMRTCGALCNLKVRRAGPMWGINGIVAECIEKLEYFREAGFELELMKGDGEAYFDEVVKEGDLKYMSKIQFLMCICVMAIPNVILLLLWSAMGAGYSIFGVLAPASMNLLGNFFVGGSCTVMFLMYLSDWHQWESKWERGMSAIVVIYVSCIGGILKCRFYAQAPLVITLFHIPIFIGLLRGTALRQVQRSSFYRSISLSAGIIGLGMILIWLAWILVPAWDGGNMYNDVGKQKFARKSKAIYDAFLIPPRDGEVRSLDFQWDCVDKKQTDFTVMFSEKIDNGYKFTDKEIKARARNCGTAQTAWFLLYLCPFIGSLVNFIMAIFTGINGSVKDVADTSRAEKTLKQFFLMIGLLLLSMWIASSVAGASMRLTSTLFAFCGAGLIVLFVWVYVEIGIKLASLRESKIMITIIMVVTNNWFRACLVIGFNVLIPAFFMIEVAHAKVRRLRKRTDSKGWLTSEGQAAWTTLRRWQWAHIFAKVNLLVMIYWCMSIGISKVTVLFLAWLNQVLSSLSYGVVIIIFFCIGMSMFMMPPVPGLPIFITAGIILSEQARDTPMGWIGGLGVAVVLSFCLKQLSAMGQYAIGKFAGRSVKVQQFVGVDKVLIRAVEHILIHEGFFGRVAVLTGGPDWPTNVLCGILRINLCTCIVGNSPVIFVSTPCVLAGALMAGPVLNIPESQKAMWSALANTSLAASAFIQTVCGFLSLYYIQQIMDKHGEKLRARRPEHDAIVAMTIREQDMNDSVDEAMNTESLSRPMFFTITFATGMMCMSLFLFLFFDELCFDSFAIVDRIDDPEGMNCGPHFGCALVKLVRPPLGVIALVLFFSACLIHYIWGKFITKNAKVILAAKRARQALEPPEQIEAERIEQEKKNEEAGENTGLVGHLIVDAVGDAATGNQD